MRVCHDVTAAFEDPNLVSCAGLVPVLQLADRARLQLLVADHVKIDKPAGVNADLKVASLVAGMIAGADSINDMDLLRHGAMGRLFTGVRAPSTLGTFLRSFTFGHVRQFDAVASRLLMNLAGQAPLLSGADEPTYVDVDDTLHRSYEPHDHPILGRLWAVTAQRRPGRSRTVEVQNRRSRPCAETGKDQLSALQPMSGPTREPAEDAGQQPARAGRATQGPHAVRQAARAS
jgi:hypothetical protein